MPYLGANEVNSGIPDIKDPFPLPCDSIPQPVVTLQSMLLSCLQYMYILKVFTVFLVQLFVQDTKNLERVSQGSISGKSQTSGLGYQESE